MENELSSTDVEANEDANGKPVWYKYSSIENEKEMSRYQTPSDTFVVTEKVDGSNFCMSVPEDPAEPLEFYTRNLRLGPTDDFLGFRSNDGLMARFTSLASIVRSSEYKSGLVYGELFGGYYTKPVEEVKGRKVERRKPVQKNVEYSPCHHFVAFDFRPRASAFLGWSDFCETIPEAYRVSSLFEGSLTSSVEWCASNHTFRTSFGEDHPEANRTVEGFVLRRVSNSGIKFKYRTPAFLDKPDEGARASSVKTEKPRPEFPASLTRQRFLSAVTKIPREADGKIHMKYVPALTDELVADVTKEDGVVLEKKTVGWFVREEVMEFNSKV